MFGNIPASGQEGKCVTAPVEGAQELHDTGPTALRPRETSVCRRFVPKRTPEDRVRLVILSGAM